MFFNFKNAPVLLLCYPSPTLNHFFFEEPLIGAGKHWASASRSIPMVSIVSICHARSIIGTHLIHFQIISRYRHALQVNPEGRGRQMPYHHNHHPCPLAVVVEGT